MTRRNTAYEMLAPLLALIFVPQLLFFWLAPVTAVARYVIYAMGTVITVAAAVVAFLVYHQCGLRRSAGVVVLAAMAEGVTIAVCAVLLLVNAAIRSAVFALAIVMLLSLAGVAPVALAVLRDATREAYSPRQWQDPAPTPVYRRVENSPAPEHPALPRRETGSGLPPRNR